MAMLIPESDAVESREFLVRLAGKRSVEVSIEPTTDRDFEHLRRNRYRWMHLRCVETGARSNQLISHARKLARAVPGAADELIINHPKRRMSPGLVIECLTIRAINRELERD